jgi:uncharacterized protein DUF6152
MRRSFSSFSKNTRSEAMKTGLLGISVICALLIGVRGEAHHSFGAEYDGNKPVTLKGIVTKVEWSNPHCHFYLDVKEPSGKTTNWKFEGFPPNVLARTGFKKDVTLKVGDTLTVFAWRARDGSNLAHARELTLADGHRLFFGPPAGTGEGTPVLK